MGTQNTPSQRERVLICNKQTTDTAAAADTQQLAMEHKAGQKEEASWEDHNKEAKIALAEAEYKIITSCIENI